MESSCFDINQKQRINKIEYEKEKAQRDINDNCLCLPGNYLFGQSLIDGFRKENPSSLSE